MFYFVGLSRDMKPRLLLLFYTHPFFSIGQSRMDLVQAMLRHYGNVVVAGGVVDSFFLDNVNDARYAPTTHATISPVTHAFPLCKCNLRM